MAKRNAKVYPGRYLIVYYEKLVTEPEVTARQVCDFLGENYIPAMITLEGAPEFIRKIPDDVSKNISGTPVYTDFIGRYRHVIPKTEIAFMQLMLGREMKRHGYTLDAINLSRQEVVQYYINTLPLNLSRMFTWLTMNYLQLNFPSRFGRKPPADKVRP
jgi:hypothetical protein